MNCDGVMYSPELTRAMGHLVHTLNDFVRVARNVEVKHFRRYFQTEGAQYVIGASKTL